MDTQLTLAEKLLTCASLLEVRAAEAVPPATPEKKPAVPAPENKPAPAKPASPEPKKEAAPPPPEKEAAPPEEAAPEPKEEETPEEEAGDAPKKEQTPEEKKVFVGYKGDDETERKMVITKRLGYFCSTCAFFTIGNGTDGKCNKFGFESKTYGLCNAYKVGSENKWNSPMGKKSSGPAPSAEPAPAAPPSAKPAA